jgi:NitT/TauT family transport system substrate-binding protein
MTFSRPSARASAVLTLGLALVATGCSGEEPAGDDGATAVSMRLEWFPQAQFAGFMIAEHKGWYDEAGVDMTLAPGGPDIQAARQVVTGVDDFGVTQPNRVVAARANGGPIVQVLQYHQTGMSVYIARKDSGIETIEDVRGRSVGLWMGGDEFEFLGMLDAAGISQDDVEIVPQGATITPFLEGAYDVVQVTTFNELQLVLANGLTMDDLTVLSADDLGVALLGDGLSTSEDLIADDPETVQAVVDASLRGWKFAIENPREAAEIIAEMAEDTSVEEQYTQLVENAKLVCTGLTLTDGLGTIGEESFQVAADTLVDSEQIDEAPDLAEAMTNRFIDEAPEEYRTVDCSEFA